MVICSVWLGQKECPCRHGISPFAPESGWLFQELRSQQAPSVHLNTSLVCKVGPVVSRPVEVIAAADHMVLTLGRRVWQQLGLAHASLFQQAGAGALPVTPGDPHHTLSCWACPAPVGAERRCASAWSSARRDRGRGAGEAAAPPGPPGARQPSQEGVW